MEEGDTSIRKCSSVATLGTESNDNQPFENLKLWRLLYDGFTLTIIYDECSSLTLFLRI